MAGTIERILLVARLSGLRKVFDALRWIRNQGLVKRMLATEEIDLHQAIGKKWSLLVLISLVARAASMLRYEEDQTLFQPLSLASSSAKGSAPKSWTQRIRDSFLRFRSRPAPQVFSTCLVFCFP